MRGTGGIVFVGIRWVLVASHRAIVVVERHLVHLIRVLVHVLQGGKAQQQESRFSNNQSFHQQEFNGGHHEGNDGRLDEEGNDEERQDLHD